MNSAGSQPVGRMSRPDKYIVMVSPSRRGIVVASVEPPRSRTLGAPWDTNRTGGFYGGEEGPVHATVPLSILGVEGGAP